MATLLDYLQHQWLFDDGSGSTANDNIGSWDGTLTNSPSWDPGGWLTFNGLTGETNGSYVHISAVSNPGSSGETNFIYYAEFKANSGNGAAIIGHEQLEYAPLASTKHDRVIYIGTDGKIRFGWIYSGAVYVIATTKTYADGTWCKVAAQHCPAGTGKLWVNGEYIGSIQPTSGSSIVTNAGHLRIGGIDMRNTEGSWPYGPNGYISFDGSIRDVRYYHTTSVTCMSDDIGEDLTRVIIPTSNALMFSCNT